MSVEVGQVYQDGEGTIMVALSSSEDGHDSHWAVFLNSNPISGDNEKVVYPLSLLFDLEGNNTGDKLRYPNGSVFRD